MKSRFRKKVYAFPKFFLCRDKTMALDSPEYFQQLTGSSRSDNPDIRITIIVLRGISLIFLFYCSLVIVLFAILSHGLPYFGRKIIHVGENS